MASLRGKAFPRSLLVQPANRSAIEESLDHDLPECYDKTSFKSKIALLMNHFIDMAVQGYGWIGAA